MLPPKIPPPPVLNKVLSEALSRLSRSQENRILKNELQLFHHHLIQSDIQMTQKLKSMRNQLSGNYRLFSKSGSSKRNPEENSNNSDNSNKNNPGGPISGFFMVLLTAALVHKMLSDMKEKDRKKSHPANIL